LWRRTPMLRGDDVAELQQRLGALGFDTGRVDGIFGRQTAEALAEFSATPGFRPTGSRGRPLSPSCTACSCATAFPSWSRPCATGSGCATPRRRWSGATWPSARAAAWPPPPGPAPQAGGRRGAGDLPAPSDGSAQAHEANAVGAEVYIGLRLDPAMPAAPRPSTPATPTNPRGRRLGELIQSLVLPLSACPTKGSRACPCRCCARPRCRGHRRGRPGQRRVERGPVLADALLRALVAWATTSWD